MTRMNLYAFAATLLLPALGCSPKPSYQITGDRCDFNESCTKKLAIQVSDARKLGEFQYYSDRGIGGSPEPGAVGMRDYTTYGIWSVKFKNDPLLYRPAFPGTSVYSTGQSYANNKDSYFNSWPEQCHREFPVHPNIESYVFVLYGYGKGGADTVGWRVVEILAAQGMALMNIGDLAKGMPIEEHPHRAILVIELRKQMQRLHPDLPLPN